jgi:hemerythrin-like domain-containing protein
MLRPVFEDSVSVGKLVESHAALVSELAALEGLAHHIAGCPGQAALDNLSGIMATLPTRLEDHMAAEEARVYPQLVDSLGQLEVASMLEDHNQIRSWVARLLESCTRLDREQPNLDDVRWTLLVVIGLVNLHLRKEELAYLRVLTHQVETNAS